MQNAKQRAARVKVILTDVDGILTDGKVNFFVTQDGRIEEFKSFNTQDGIAAMLCHSAKTLFAVGHGKDTT